MNKESAAVPQKRGSRGQFKFMDVTQEAAVAFTPCSFWGSSSGWNWPLSVSPRAIGRGELPSSPPKAGVTLGKGRPHRVRQGRSEQRTFLARLSQGCEASLWPGASSSWPTLSCWVECFYELFTRIWDIICDRRTKWIELTPGDLEAGPGLGAPPANLKRCSTQNSL